MKFGSVLGKGGGSSLSRYTESGINLTPMIDVVFNLIIFLMLSSAFVKASRIPVDLPDSVTANPAVQQSLNVIITAGGEIFLNDRRIARNSLNSEIFKESRRRNVDQVVVYGDRSIPYHLAIEVLDAARLAGVKTIGLSAQKRIGR